MIVSREQKVCTSDRNKLILYGKAIWSNALLVLACGLFLFSSCASTEIAPAFEGGPRIFFDNDFIDLGEATPNQQLYAEFHFQNVGDAPLVLYDTTKQVLEGCCPPQPVVRSMMLQPNEESSIIIDYVMGRQMEGMHLFKYTVESNDPVEPKKNIYLKIDYIFGR